MKINIASSYFYNRIARQFIYSLEQSKMQVLLDVGYLDIKSFYKLIGPMYCMFLEVINTPLQINTVTFADYVENIVKEKHLCYVIVSRPRNNVLVCFPSSVDTLLNEKYERVLKLKSFL